MLFALPIGIFLLLGEKKARAKYQAIFDNFYQSINTKQYSQKQKMHLYEEMLHKNDYIITEKNQDAVVGEKKILSIGWLFIGIGTLYVGLLVYIVYFLYFQKPHVVRFVVG
jgi:uncharacterized membrane protein YukC